MAARCANGEARAKDSKSGVIGFRCCAGPENEAEVTLDVRWGKTLEEFLRIEKQRYEVPQGDLMWEIDVFEGRPGGLVLAEIELPSEEEAFKLPGWIGAEVTDDPRYRNSSLAAAAGAPAKPRTPRR